ncbi:MAG: glycosyltransferase family 2 protein [bacterium]|nr:glycosyltransferase family 2 protein [bacterium]
MSREAPRTLHSLSTAYQEGVDEDSYEVIVIENGSDHPGIGTVAIRQGSNFRYHYIEDANQSPAAAMNRGIRMAHGRHVGLLVDGARIVTPGMVKMALLGLSLFPRAIVSTLAWHLGPKTQMQSVAEGYDADVEDALLDSIGWPTNGYDLFTISALAGSSANGFFRPIAESNALFMPRLVAEELGGFDERFALPGGGVVNLDLYERSCALPGTTLVTLLGEGTFHQVHGGVATNRAQDSDYEQRAFAEYAQLRGRSFQRPEREPIYLGSIPDQALPFLASSLRALEPSNGGGEPT